MGSTSLMVRGIGKRKMDQLAAQASRLGMTPEKYVKHLVEDNLAIAREARATPFSRLMGSGRVVDEEELDRLVEGARARHHRRTMRKR